MSRTIRISEDVSAWIQRERRPGESANAVIRRVLGIPSDDHEEATCGCSFCAGARSYVALKVRP